MTETQKFENWFRLFFMPSKNILKGKKLIRWSQLCLFSMDRPI